MFIRRIFYSLETGEVLQNYSMLGNGFHITDSELDFGVYEELQGHSLEDTGVMEWTEPDEEIEVKMNGNYVVSVDVSVEPHALVFTEKEAIPEDEQTATLEDYKTALSELGVTV